jgi:transcriptional regulator GlxA family with amidase domain
VEDFESGNAARRKVLLLEIQTRLHRLALNMPSQVPNQPSTAASGGEARIETITKHINTRYFENITVREIADTVGLNPRYLMKLFRTHTGMSVWEYVSRLRVCHAQRLLITTNEKITDIAFQSGFGSTAPFYATFRKLGGGKNPRTFRQAHR